jgi:hypothetical protein
MLRIRKNEKKIINNMRPKDTSVLFVHSRLKY